MVSEVTAPLSRLIGVRKQSPKLLGRVRAQIHGCTQNKGAHWLSFHWKPFQDLIIPWMPAAFFLKYRGISAYFWSLSLISHNKFGIHFTTYSCTLVHHLPSHHHAKKSTILFAPTVHKGEQGCVLK